MAAPELQYITLIDFTPGISSRRATSRSLVSDLTGLNHRPSQVADGVMDGVAQESGTYACYGDPKGGLWPLPTPTTALIVDVDSVNETDGWTADNPTHKIYLLDMCVMSPVIDRDQVDWTNSLPDALFVSYYWYSIADEAFEDIVPGDTIRRAIGRQHKLYKPGGIFTVWNFRQTVLSADEEALLAYSMWFTCRASYNIEALDDPNIQRIGLPQVRGMISVVPSNDVSFMHRAIAFPSDPNLDTIRSPSPETQDNKGEMVWFMGHQGRSVFGMRRTGSDSDQFLEPFGTDGAMPIGEAMSWSDVNFSFLKFESNIFLDKTAWVEETPSGYGAMASVNAGELFLVKHKGGGAVIRGSLDNPTVVKLANIEPTRGVMAIPATSPYGVFYGSRSGIWAWTGGDSSECISPMLDGFFWEEDTFTREGRVGLKGRFVFSYPYVFVSNDWVYDVRTKGWFKLVDRTTGGAGEDCHPFMFYDTSWDGRVYASPGAVDLTHDVAASILDPEVVATKYQWKSQPFAATMNKDIEFRTVVVVAQGFGAVEVTMEGLTGETQTERFEFQSTQPIRLETPTTCRATDPTVTLYSEGFVVEGEVVTSHPAPVIHSVHLGYTPKSNVPSSQAQP